MPRRRPAILDKPNDIRAKYDWQSIRRDYIEGVDDGTGTVVYPTMLELSEKYDVSVSMLENRASREKWAPHRKAEQNRVAIERQKMLAKKLAKKQVKFDEQAAEDAMQTQVALGKRIVQMSRLYELDNLRIEAMMQRIEDGEAITEMFRKELRSLVSASEWESLWKAYALANDVGRKALGIKDDEAPATNNTFITQVNNNAPTQTLRESDRNQAILAALQNPNMIIPGVTIDVPEIEAAPEEEVVEAEVVENVD